jgi:hypothetical protein
VAGAAATIAIAAIAAILPLRMVLPSIRLRIEICCSARQAAALSRSPGTTA